jgi:pyrroline-5-carboxylate reductase
MTKHPAWEAARIGFLGGGAMGEALAAGILAAGRPAAQVRVADPAAERRAHLARVHGLTSSDDNAAVVAESDVVVLAVKPALVTEALLALGGPAEPDLARPLWISIAAGISTGAMLAALPPGARVVRAMPNTPALVGCGATGFCASASCTPADRDAAMALFEGVGMAWEAPEEHLLDAVTGLSGSGPAYVFLLLEGLSEAGAQLGLPPDVATALSIQTVLGAAQLARKTGQPPAALRERVTSPGGTTVAGLERLEARQFRGALHDAVAAAARRSKELGS